MTLQISKSEPKLLNAELRIYGNGYWSVSGAGVCALFLFDHPDDARQYYGSEEGAHRNATVFMVAMQNANNPAAMLRAQIEADFNKGCEE